MLAAYVCKGSVTRQHPCLWSLQLGRLSNLYLVRHSPCTRRQGKDTQWLGSACNTRQAPLWVYDARSQQMAQQQQQHTLVSWVPEMCAAVSNKQSSRRMFVAAFGLEWEAVLLLPSAAHSPHWDTSVRPVKPLVVKPVGHGQQLR